MAPTCLSMSAERQLSFAQRFSTHSVPIGQPPLQVAIRTGIQNQTATVVIRRTSDGNRSCQPRERLDGSLRISYLEAEGFIESIRSDCNAVTCVFPQIRTNSFARKAKMAVESPFAALEENTRSALSKLLHDLKNHLVGAEVAVAVKTTNRTLALRAQAEASEHLDAACRLADQFASLAGVLGQPNIEEVSVSDFFKRLCARLFATLPQSISLGVPGASKNASVWTSEQFIESIIDNLVRNSVDAMNGQGRLELAWEIDEDSRIWRSRFGTPAQDATGIAPATRRWRVRLKLETRRKRGWHVNCGFDVAKAWG